MVRSLPNTVKNILPLAAGNGGELEGGIDILTLIDHALDEFAALGQAYADHQLAICIEALTEIANLTRDNNPISDYDIRYEAFGVACRALYQAGGPFITYSHNITLDRPFPPRRNSSSPSPSGRGGQGVRAEEGL